MLTFFEAWPAFHICAGQGVLFTLSIMRHPQLLFCTLKEPFKRPHWCGIPCFTLKGLGVVGGISLRVRIKLGRN